MSLRPHSITKKKQLQRWQACHSPWLGGFAQILSPLCEGTEMIRPGAQPQRRSRRSNKYKPLTPTPPQTAPRRPHQPNPTKPYPPTALRFEGGDSYRPGSANLPHLACSFFYSVALASFNVNKPHRRKIMSCCFHGTYLHDRNIERVLTRRPVTGARLRYICPLPPPGLYMRGRRDFEIQDNNIK